jgi:hypothetical protein
VFESCGSHQLSSSLKLKAPQSLTCLTATVSAHFMKTLATILLIFLSFDLFGQIDSRNDWPKSIQKEFELIKGQKIDTFLIYYSYLGPWTNLPDSCNGISAVWAFWIKNKEYYYKKLSCDSVDSSKVHTISSRPFDCFLKHINDFNSKEQYLKRNKFLPPIPTDGSWEYLIFMSSKNKICLNLSEHQRTDTIWRQFEWIKPTIETIDITVNELNKNGR